MNSTSEPSRNVCMRACGTGAEPGKRPRSGPIQARYTLTCAASPIRILGSQFHVYTALAPEKDTRHETRDMLRPLGLMSHVSCLGYPPIPTKFEKIARNTTIMLDASANGAINST